MERQDETDVERSERVLGEIRELVYRAQSVQGELQFLQRVLRQAIMTHGGRLPVDPALAGAAKKDTRPLLFECGGITFGED